MDILNSYSFFSVMSRYWNRLFSQLWLILLYDQLKKWRSVGKGCIQGHQSSGSGALKKMRTMETCKKSKQLLQIMLVSVQHQCWPRKQQRKLQKTIVNFLGARITAINLFQIDFDKPYNYSMMLLWKKTSAPVVPFWIDTCSSAI